MKKNKKETLILSSLRTGLKPLPQFEAMKARSVGTKPQIEPLISGLPGSGSLVLRTSERSLLTGIGAPSSGQATAVAAVSVDGTRGSVLNQQISFARAAARPTTLVVLFVVLTRAPQTELCVSFFSSSLSHGQGYQSLGGVVPTHHGQLPRRGGVQHDHGLA